MFTIITPTYRRSKDLKRAIASVIAQSNPNWELIVVNDSPEDTSYHAIPLHHKDYRISYLKNEINMGVNYSRNRALNLASPSSEWVIFLDDDDYLEPDTLKTLETLIKKYRDVAWFVTDRVYENGTSITQFPKSNTRYSYAWDYLISKRCKGDATHCIAKDMIGSIRFSQEVKQGEEWFFFYQVGLKTKMFYHKYKSTFSTGYSSTGLNFRRRSKQEQVKTWILLLHEAISLQMVHRVTFGIYMLLRLIRIAIK